MKGRKAALSVLPALAACLILLLLGGCTRRLCDGPPPPMPTPAATGSPVSGLTPAPTPSPPPKSWPTLRPTPVPTPTPPPPPANLKEYSAEDPAPDFLDEEQKEIFRLAMCLRRGLLFTGALPYGKWAGPATLSAFLDGTNAHWKSEGEKELDGYLYQIGSADYYVRDGRYDPGRYPTWGALETDILEAFTPQGWRSASYLPDGDGTEDQVPRYRDIDGYIGYVPDAAGHDRCCGVDYRLDQRSEDAVSFTVIEHLSYVMPEYAGLDIALADSYPSEVSVNLVRTPDGWRVADFHVYCGSLKEKEQGRGHIESEA